jgi:hypothetical protein
MIERQSSDTSFLEIRLSGHLARSLALLFASAFAVGFWIFVALVFGFDQDQVEKGILTVSVPWFAILYFVDRQVGERGILIRIDSEMRVVGRVVEAMALLAGGVLSAIHLLAQLFR